MAYTGNQSNIYSSGLPDWLGFGGRLPNYAGGDSSGTIASMLAGYSNAQNAMGGLPNYTAGTTTPTTTPTTPTGTTGTGTGNAPFPTTPIPQTTPAPQTTPNAAPSILPGLWQGYFDPDFLKDSIFYKEHLKQYQPDQTPSNLPPPTFKRAEMNYGQPSEPSWHPPGFPPNLVDPIASFAFSTPEQMDQLWANYYLKQPGWAKPLGEIPQKYRTGESDNMTLTTDDERVHALPYFGIIEPAQPPAQPSETSPWKYTGDLRGIGGGGHTADYNPTRYGGWYNPQTGEQIHGTPDAPPPKGVKGEIPKPETTSNRPIPADAPRDPQAFLKKYGAWNPFPGPNGEYYGPDNSFWSNPPTTGNTQIGMIGLTPREQNYSVYPWNKNPYDLANYGKPNR